MKSNPMNEYLPKAQASYDMFNSLIAYINDSI